MAGMNKGQAVATNHRTAVLRIALIAGTLDIADALVWNLFRGVRPSNVFQYIASGLIGVRAFRLGAGSVVLGVVLHYAIALIWTAIFYLLARNFALLLRRPVLNGLLYGICVYVVMNFVVLPLSAIPPALHAPTFGSRINGILALMFCIGLTISLLMRRHFGEYPR